MENEQKQQLKETVGEIHKHSEMMPDGKRYIIYYVFGDEEKSKKEDENHV